MTGGPAPSARSAWPATVGCDIGGTRTKTTVLRADGHVLAERTAPTPPDVRARIGGFVAEQVDAVGSVPAGVPVGVVVPGIVDEDAGVATWSANLGWRDLDVVAAVGAVAGRPVVLGHDVRAGLVAEVELGAARGERDVLFVPLGTGIAAGVMVDGVVLRARGWAGELGHAVVEPGGPACACGGHGCLEAVASASGLARRYAAESGAVGPVTSVDVIARASTGDDVAARVWQLAVAGLAQVLSLTCAATGIRLVVLGGGLANAGDGLLEPLRAALAVRASVVPAPRVVRAALGDRSGSIGAALRAREAGPLTRSRTPSRMTSGGPA